MIAVGEEEESALTPKRLEELPLHVRQFLASLTKEDVASFAHAIALFKWMNTTGRIGRVIIVTGLSVFGAMVAAAQGWDYFMARFFITKGGP